MEDDNIRAKMIGSRIEYLQSIRANVLTETELLKSNSK